MKPNIGIKPENLAKVTQSLSHILADEMVLYMKTRNAHWNVEGPDFHSMHVYFEAQYTDLEQIIDTVAERIRTLGHYAPATLKQILELTHLTEQVREKNDSLGFIKELLGDHESIIVFIRSQLNLLANGAKDLGTSDYLTGLTETHEKMAWMLRSHLK